MEFDKYSTSKDDLLILNKRFIVGDVNQVLSVHVIEKVLAASYFKFQVTKTALLIANGLKLCN